MAKVFVSHKDSDVAIARIVSSRLQMHRFEVYLDAVDPALRRDGPELSDYLLKRMGECQQLIAVVSSATASSWWVPWEIGVGSEKGFRMASFSQSFVQLPSFLRKWPSLRSMKDIDTFCQFSTRTDQGIRTATAGVLSEAMRMGAQMSRAADFHRDLKAALARR